MSSREGRISAAPWSRLKPVTLDALEEMGLPSKGDNRLLDYKTQERYYTKIVERYMDFCTDAGQGDELSRRLARVEISSETRNGNAQRSAASIDGASIDVNVEQKSISTLMMAMRKLREGIVASHRVDDFAIQAYIFCIRLSILVKQMESYHPAILHLLKKMHPVQALTNTELQEFAGYLVLDLACRQNDLAQAFSMRFQYGLRDSKVDAVLQALSHDNYFLFWKVKRSVDGHKAKLMEFAESDMRKQTLKCLGRSYLNIDQRSLEQYTQASWSTLCKDYAVGWQLESNKVVIRKPKAR